MRTPTATGQEPISAITYPARPVNGGPLDKALPKSVSEKGI